VPTVCGLCPVGCNVSATTREGKVRRILSRNHPEVDEGWLCDKGRFAFSHLRAADRIQDPLRKAGPRRFEALSWTDALDDVERVLRDAGASIVTALSGSETVEQAYGLGKLLRQGLGAHTAVLPEPVPDALDSFRAPLSAIRDAPVVVILCDEPVVERAPVVDLWIKAARRRGARIVTELPEERLEDAVLISDDADRCAWFARDLDAAAAFYLPRTPNGRGVADAWAAASDGEPSDEPPKLVIVSRELAAADAAVRALAENAETVIGIGMFEDTFRGWCDFVLPGTSYLERDGTTVNLEGRLQRQRRAVIGPCPDELAWIAKLAERFEVELSPYAAIVFEEIAGRCYGGISLSDITDRAPLPARVESSEPLPNPLPATVATGNGLRLLVYRPLFSGAAVERTPELQFMQPKGEVELAPDDARARGIGTGDVVNVHSNGTSKELRARVARDLAPGLARIPRDDAIGLHEYVEVTK
jgi:predicted molibdopterin-dependent oxidoreductase YjgC